MKASEFQITENEAENINSSKAGILEYLYVLMLMLYAGRATTFFESLYITDNPIGVLIPVIFSGIIAIKHKLFFTSRFYVLLFAFALYFIAISIKYYVIQPTFIITYYILFFITYTSVRVLKFDLFKIYERILFYFAIISLFFWSIQVFLGGDALFSIFSRSAYLKSISFVSGEGINAFIYSIQPYATTIINEHTIARNCGFAWEPGSYAVYLCLGIFINLFISRGGKDNRIRLYVLIVATLTTLSTTGYVLLAFIALVYVLNKDLKKILLMLPVMAAVLILLFSLPFMKDKIVKLMSETGGLEEIVYQSYGRETPITPQRFSSLKIAFIDFKNNPVLGLAAHYEESWTYRIGSRISAISGIGNLMAQFGIIGLLFFIVLSIKSSMFFAEYFHYRGKLLLFFILIGISVSYTIIFIPFIMCFWMFSFFETDIQLLPKEETENGFNEISTSSDEMRTK